MLTALVLSLLPLARVGLDWVQVYRLTGVMPGESSPSSFDWVVWEDRDGEIRATYVFPHGPAAGAGLRVDDAFYMLDGFQYFSAEDLESAMQGTRPGEMRTFYLMREAPAGDGDELVTVPVRFTRYPTFLYPLSEALWTFSLWGFTLGAFFHILGLAIAAPLARRSRKALQPLLLIFVSFLWMAGNLSRMILVDLFGPAIPNSLYDHVFQTLTLVSLFGWIAFPVLLFRKVLCDADIMDSKALGFLRYLIYVAPAILGVAVVTSTARGVVGPLTLDGLLVPILFYASVYIASAALLVLTLYSVDRRKAEALMWGWGRLGSTLTLAASIVTALTVLGVVPILGAVTDTTAGWLIVCAQLLFIAPVTLVSVAPLQHGRVEDVLTRALTYLTVLGLFFFAYVGGMTLLEPLLVRAQAPRHVTGGFVAILLLLIFERLARPLRTYARALFLTERQRARQMLRRFQEEMRDILDHTTLIQRCIDVVGPAIGTRSAILFLRPSGPTGPWISSVYHPEPPYLTDRIFYQIWTYFEGDGRIWARNSDLSERELPVDATGDLTGPGVALAVPILGENATMGLLVIGQKKKRGAVYNLEDLEQLRTLSSQLALAVERLNLVERERALIRQHAEAQLVALRAQINPHFLFNALNTIASLIGERPDEAELTVENLAGIFRHVLKTSGHSFISLEEELEVVSNYLQIEQARFGEKLEVSFDVDESIQNERIPAFVVQTLVENAVKHGLEKQRDGGCIHIAAHVLDGMMEIEISDTGVGIPALFSNEKGEVAPGSFFGIGLTNVSSRLEQLYGRSDLLTIDSHPGKGTTARMCIPLDGPDEAA